MNTGDIVLLFKIYFICVTGVTYGADSTELYLFPSYMQVELRGSVTIPVSLKQASSATLSIAQDIGGAFTDVFTINGTVYELLNFWNGKASVEVSNGTDIIWANITLTNVALEDEGSYKVKVKGGGKDVETLYNTGHFRIDTYALPIYTNIATADDLQVKEGTEVTFACTGNVGRPPGNLELVQTSSLGYSHTADTVIILDLPESSREMLANGTYRVQHDFNVNLTRNDNGTTFRCRNVHHIPNLSVKESQPTRIAYVNFSGLSFTFTRDSILIGDTGTQTLKCSVDESDVQGIYSIKMFRETVPGSNVQEPLAALDILDNPTEPKLLLTQDGFTVGGTWDTGNIQSNFLEVNMDMEKLECKDARQYKCDLSYAPLSGASTKTVTANATFSAYVEPVINSLDGKKNDFNLQFPNLGLSLQEKADFEIGNVLKLTCSAQIGSKPDTKIRWRMTSEIALDDNEFIQYNPPEGTYTEGTALSDNDCGYDRTASITYNTSAADANRKNNLIFECYVTVSGAPYTTIYTDQKHFYMHVSGGTADPNPAPATAGAGNAGAIAGGVVGGLVLIVIIVLLVYFLWYRRRNSGEDYTTKEEYGSENPNMAPPADTYASVDKHRNRGHENKGLDEPHEKRRHHYANGPGKSNYGMDRDADDYDYESRDGSPSRNDEGINHMGVDPHGRIGTGV